MRFILRFFKKLLVVGLCLLAIVVGALFAYENPNDISPIFLGHALPSVSLGLYLAAAIFFGMCIGVALSFWSAQAKQFRLKSENRRLKKVADKLVSTDKQPDKQLDKY